MDAQTRIALTRQIQRHLRARTNELAPAEHHNPITEYVDSAWLAREQELLFQRMPLIVGHTSALRNAGDFLTNERTGLPLLVVRQADGSLGAFVNVCRHRGARVVEAVSGNARKFRCPYHAWTYAIDGSLQNIPEAGAFPGIEREARGLRRVPVEERHGFVWVVARPDAKIDVAAHLGALDREFEAFGLDAYVEERNTKLDERLNWKLVVDGFLEVYHLPALHPTTAGSLIHGRPALFEPFGPHGRMVAVRKSFDAWIDADPETVDPLPHVAIIYQLFPNSILIWQGDHFELWSMYADPVEPAHCMSAVSLLAPSDAEARDRVEHWDRNWKILLDTVEEEDFRVARLAQRGFNQGATRELLFGRNEPALQHFHRSLHRELA